MFYTIYLFLLLLHMIFPATAAAPAYTPTDLILLNCGASSILIDASNRSWAGDDRSKFLPPNASTISLAATATEFNPSFYPAVPYQTARVFRNSFTYTFPMSKGHKFLRLYLYHGIYSDYNTSQSLFSVSANGFTLSSNFSTTLMKEFIITIKDNDDDKLVLTFSPNPSSFAFISGIEIVSIPDKLYTLGKDGTIKYVNMKNVEVFYDFYLGFNSALENLYRLNVGGSSVDIEDDSGMFRAWSPDNSYLMGASGDKTTAEKAEVIK